MTSDLLGGGTRPSRRNGVAIAGLALGLVGVVGYFVVVFHGGARLPGVRNTAAPNWLVIAVGLALSALGVWRTIARPALFPGRRLALALGAGNVGLAAAFAWLLYGMSAVPFATGPRIGAPAPPLAVTDQDGRTVSLADFRGAPLLLVFYRGHW